MYFSGPAAQKRRRVTPTQKDEAQAGVGAQEDQAGFQPSMPTSKSISLKRQPISAPLSSLWPLLPSRCCVNPPRPGSPTLLCCYCLSCLLMRCVCKHSRIHEPAAKGSGAETASSTSHTAACGDEAHCFRDFWGSPTGYTVPWTLCWRVASPGVQGRSPGPISHDSPEQRTLSWVTLIMQSHQ